MKRFLLIILCFMLMSNLSFSNIKQASCEILVKMNLLSGYPDGTLKLENNITRAEFSVLIMKMLGHTNDNIVLTTNKEFNDLKETHWAHKSVIKATELGYLSGYDDNTFRPSNNLTYAECCSIMVNVLGYKSTLKGKWPDNVINKAIELKITQDILAKKSDDLMSRGEVAIMLTNALNVKLK